jgi:glycerol-3-phosphate acyltransferase PlsY
MNPLIASLAAVVGYLCGSISFARLVSRIVAPQEDITKTEIEVDGSEETFDMGSVSATTVSMHIGPRFGFLTVVMDMLKITIPTLAFKRLYPEAPYSLMAATAGMVGHIWPIYHSFKGGRGLSAVYGGMFAIDWIGVFATSLGGMVLGLFVIRDFLVAYMGGLWLIIPWLWFRTHDLGHLAYGIAINIIFVLAMIPEIKQYLKFRREGKGEDLLEVMQLTGMGRGISKMAKRFGLIENKTESTKHPHNPNS